jgi:hypothetical protein
MTTGRFDIIEDNGSVLTLAFLIGRDLGAKKTAVGFGLSSEPNQLRGESILVDKEPIEVVRALRRVLDEIEVKLTL